MQFYGLLYIDESDFAVNVRVRTPAARLAMYVANAVNLARSLRGFGYGFTLLTNSLAAIERYSPGLLARHGVLAREIAFTTAVPRDTLFYSAHFKFDALRHLAAEPGPCNVLVDLDVECIRALPPSIVLLAEQGCPFGYDITDQVRLTYGEERIAADLQRLAGRALPASWWGGELLGGPPEFFSRLDTVIAEVLPRYVAARRELHHQGDEMVVSAALGLLASEGVVLRDSGKLGLINRYWTQKPKHAQLPFAAVARGHALLHLPQDKHFLARRGGNSATVYGAENFNDSYLPARVWQFTKRKLKDMTGQP